MQEGKFRSAVWFSYNKLKTERDAESSSISVVLMKMITGLKIPEVPQHASVIFFLKRTMEV